jgi:photosystem II stability/assembly factor-like uncharacterized protein
MPHMTNLKKVLLISLLALLISSPAGTVSAGLNVWTGHGPEGGVISALAIDPATTATVYAGTDIGVFKSLNSGWSWSSASTGLSTNTKIKTLAIDPVTPTTLYAGTDVWGVFKSTNGGRSWTPANYGLPFGSLSHLTITSLVIDPLIPSTLYAGTIYTEKGVGGFGGVYKSTDGGATWQAVNASLPKYEIYALAIDPQTPATIYAGTYDGVYKSTDGGDNWVAFTTGLPAPNYLAIDPVMPTTLYAGVYGGVFKSTDGGGSWSVASTGLPSNSIGQTLAIDPTTPTTLYAGIGIMASNSSSGVFRSTDGGEIWEAFNNGLTDLYIRALAIDPQMPEKIFAGSGSGVFTILQMEVKSQVYLPVLQLGQ